MKKICLSQGKVALVDDDDFERLRLFKWYAILARARPGHVEKWYARRFTDDYSTGRRVRTTHYMHREIMGPAPGEVVDHQDGDGLNNQKGNLRNVPKAVNDCRFKRKECYL